MEGNVTLEMVYGELKAIRKELIRVEYAVMPVEKLSEKELKEHENDLKDALERRIGYKTLLKG